MNLARMAEQIKVSEADAGATRLASPHDSAMSRQKKLKMRQASPKRKSLSRTTCPTTASRPLRERISSRSPMRFMAAERSTSPVLEASTSVTMAIQSLSEFTLFSGRGKVTVFIVHGERGVAGHQADAAGDQQHAGPAPGTDGFMQKHAREKGCDNVAERGRGQNIGEVGPGERGEVRVKKSGQTQDTENDPGIEKGVENAGPVGEVDLAEIIHAAFEHDVARAVAAGDGQIYKKFFQVHAAIRRGPAPGRDRS